MFNELGLAYLDPDFLNKIKNIEELRKGSVKLDYNKNKKIEKKKLFVFEIFNKNKKIF